MSSLLTRKHCWCQGFHEAIGDTMAMSVNTPAHLYKIKLLDEVDNSRGTRAPRLRRHLIVSLSYRYRYIIHCYVITCSDNVSIGRFYNNVKLYIIMNPFRMKYHNTLYIIN